MWATLILIGLIGFVGCELLAPEPVPGTVTMDTTGDGIPDTVFADADGNNLPDVDADGALLVDADATERLRRSQGANGFITAVQTVAGAIPGWGGLIAAGIGATVGVIKSRAAARAKRVFADVVDTVQNARQTVTDRTAEIVRLIREGTPESMARAAELIAAIPAQVDAELADQWRETSDAVRELKEAEQIPEVKK